MSKRGESQGSALGPGKLKGLDTANLTMAAIRGIQAGREYYVTMVPLDLLPRIFVFDEEVLPAELRAQRSINKARIPDISRYVLDNLGDYVFSSITASVDSPISFEPLGETGTSSKVGVLTVPLSARFVINDGQHRRAAIEMALKEKPELRHETISVVFFIDGGLKRCQQMFADLNQHAVRPTRSLGILYDHRNELAQLANHLAFAVPIFKGMIEKEKTTISNRSNKLFTLNSLHQATRELLGKRTNARRVSDEERKLAEEFWIEMSKHVPEWQLAAAKKITCAELRKEYVHTHGVVLHALGFAGASLLHQHPKDWKQVLKKLESIDWVRSNTKVWEGRATVGGHMSKARMNLVLTASYLKQILGLSLAPEEEKAERQFGKGKIA